MTSNTNPLEFNTQETVDYMSALRSINDDVASVSQRDLVTLTANAISSVGGAIFDGEFGDICVAAGAYLAHLNKARPMMASEILGSKRTLNDAVNKYKLIGVPRI